VKLSSSQENRGVYVSLQYPAVSWRLADHHQRVSQSCYRSSANDIPRHCAAHLTILECPSHSNIYPPLARTGERYRGRLCNNMSVNNHRAVHISPHHNHGKRIGAVNDRQNPRGESEVRPRGRGRGLDRTKPAWMTRMEQKP